jgi:enamine deaminase RidA (YjgF/YER057c/UK114 family)
VPLNWGFAYADAVSQLLDAAPSPTPEQALHTLRLMLPPPRHEDRVRLNRVGDMLYTPGVLPWWGDDLRHVGAVDGDLTIRQAARAAQLCVHNIVSLVRVELGSLDRVVHVLQISVLVQRSADFENLSRVADGASTALFQIFGIRGRHRREVVGGSDLPHNAAVQVSAVLRTI